jgi:hypothetical protein
VITDARRRLLKPQARLIPGKLRVFGLPVAIPRDERMSRIVTSVRCSR